MCFGGGGGGGSSGRITMPNTSAYDGMLQAQMSAMQSQMNGAAQQKQAELQLAQQQQQNALRQLSEYRTQRAEEAASVEAEARRMMNLVGPPPPEESAKAPVIGSNRSSQPSRQSGKRGLRIGRQTARSSGAGAGLNIV